MYTFMMVVDYPTMDTRPKQETKSPKVPRDKNFVRKQYYDRDHRWFVNRNIEFNYERQLGEELHEIEMY